MAICPAMSENGIGNAVYAREIGGRIGIIYGLLKGSIIILLCSRGASVLDRKENGRDDIGLKRRLRIMTTDTT